MKKAFAFACLLLSSSIHALPDGEHVTSINQFHGINSDASAITLIGGQTPDSQNIQDDVDLGLSGRLGFIQFSTEPSRGIWSFGKSDGTRYVITASSNILKATTNTSFTTTISTIAIAVPTYATSLGDKFFFVNTTDGLKYWNGTNAAIAVDSSKKADKITTFAGRLAIANVTGNARIIYLSKYLDGTNFTAPVNPSDDDATTITTAGVLDEAVEGLYPYQGTLMIFKPSSFLRLYGSRRSNFTLRVISDFVGLSGSESIQDCDGKLRWLSRGRKIFEYDGASFRKITEDVDTLFGTVSQGDAASRFNTQTTASDWNAGTFDNTTYVDTQTVSGSLQFLYPDNFANGFRDGNLGTRRVYQVYDSGNATHSTPFVDSLQRLNIADTNPNVQVTCDAVVVKTVQPTMAFAVGTTFQFTIDTLPSDNVSPFIFSLSSVSATTQIPRTACTNFVGNFWFAEFLSSTSGRGYLNAFNSDLVNYSLGNQADFAFSNVANIKFYLSTTTFVLTDPVDVIMSSGTHTWPNAPLYVYMGYRNRAGSNLALDRFNVAPTTFTFTSQSINIGSAITSFAPVTISDLKIGGSAISYSFGTSSSASVAPVNYTSISNTGTPTVATNTYANFKAVFSNTVATGSVGIGPASLYDFTTNWNEGSSIKLASIYPNQRYWLSVSISSTANNLILVYDRVNQWQKYSGMNADAMTMHNSKPYFGNSTGIWEAENGYTDNGSNITSYYQTPTLIPGGIDLISSYRQLYMTTENSASTLATTFQMNGINTNYSLGTVAMTQTTGINNFKLPFTNAEVQLGKYISFKWTVTGSSFWRILNGNLYSTPANEPE